MAKLMNGEKADMVFTDPPYNVAIGSKNKTLNENRIARGLKKTNSIEEDIEGDKGMTDEEIGETLWKPAFMNMFVITQRTAVVFTSQCHKAGRI